MIQRIQTVWWLLSASILAVLAFLSLPLFEYLDGDVTKSFSSLDITLLKLQNSLFIAIFFTLLNIFLFKKRKMQIFIGYILILQQLAAVAFHAFVNYKWIQETHGAVSILSTFWLWVFLLLLSVIFQILAIRAVKKDEDLLKSMDRLR